MQHMAHFMLCNQDPVRELPALQQQRDRQVTAAIESHDQQHQPYHMSSSSATKLDRNNKYVSSPKSPVIRSSLQSNDHRLPKINNATQQQQQQPIKLDLPSTITNTDDDDAAANTLMSLARKLPDKRAPTDMPGDNESGKRPKLCSTDTNSCTTTAADYESSTSPGEPCSPPPTQTTSTSAPVPNNDPTIKEQEHQHQSSPKHQAATTANAIVDLQSTSDTTTATVLSS